MRGKCYPHATERFNENKVCVNPLGEVPDTHGEKIRYYRQIKGITQKKLAADANVFFTTIIRYENLQVPLTLQACAFIAPVLGIEKKTLYDDYLSFISGQFWDKIKEIQCNSGISQRKMAELFGVWPKTIREWEKGSSIPTRTNYEAIMVLDEMKNCNGMFLL